MITNFIRATLLGFAILLYFRNTKCYEICFDINWIIFALKYIMCFRASNLKLSVRSTDGIAYQRKGGEFQYGKIETWFLMASLCFNAICAWIWGTGVDLTNIFTSSFYAHRSQKCKNSVKTSISFCAYGICMRKSFALNVKEIDHWFQWS